MYSIAKQWLDRAPCFEANHDPLVAQGAIYAGLVAGVKESKGRFILSRAGNMKPTGTCALVGASESRTLRTSEYGT